MPERAPDTGATPWPDRSQRWGGSSSRWPHPRHLGPRVLALADGEDCRTRVSATHGEVDSTVSVAFLLNE